MYFLDTNALLNLDLETCDFGGKFIISSVTLNELEQIKTSRNKDEEVKYKARNAVRYLDENDNYDVVIVGTSHYDTLQDIGLPVSPDNLIISCAHSMGPDVEFVSMDLLCKRTAQDIFKMTLGVIPNHTECYEGFKTLQLDEESMAKFYENPGENHGLLTNQYAVINNGEEDTDKYKWNGEKFVSLYGKPLRSRMFGDKIKPKDFYQAMAIDSIMNNTITAITGKQGTGKSLISLTCALSLMDNNKYDKLVILFNPIKTRGVADMGAYKGDMVDKAMQNSIGEMLTSKFGDRFGVDRMIQDNQLKLVSMGDIRGMEIADNEILYITECQNTSVDLLKLCLGRASQHSKIILEGDIEGQVDSFAFHGRNNGLRRAIEVLKGNELFGYVNLKNIWRSKIAELVELF